jgi:hypothetical protein
LDSLVRAQPSNNYRPPVRSKILQQSGEKRGIRLIDYRSLRVYLNGLPDGSRDQRPREKGITPQPVQTATALKDEA